MRYEINDFIGVFEDALDPAFCDQSIAMFERLKEMNMTTNRQAVEGISALSKDNEMAFMNKHYVTDEDALLFVKTQTNHFCENAWKCYSLYAEKYGILNTLSKHAFYDHVKIQKISPAQGYHMWHCETDNRMTGSRLLLVIAYLNDVAEGGETEFLYQSKRIMPKKGTMIFCPASYTHTHRGNPPLSGVKYIMNGWIEFTE